MKAKVSAEGSCGPMPLTLPIPAPVAGQRYCKSRVALLGPAIEAEGSTIAEFGKLLNLVLDRPVIDKTGLSGRFDIHLEFARDDATPGLRGPGPDAAPVDVNRATIFNAIQEQLGLKLRATRGPVDVLLIDHVEPRAKN